MEVCSFQYLVQLGTGVSSFQHSLSLALFPLQSHLAGICVAASKGAKPVSEDYTV